MPCLEARTAEDNTTTAAENPRRTGVRGEGEIWAEGPEIINDDGEAKEPWRDATVRGTLGGV